MHTLYIIELRCSLPSYISAPYWATMILLIYAATFWAALRPSYLLCTLFELRRTLLKYTAPYWVTKTYPTGLRCTLRSYLPTCLRISFKKWGNAELSGVRQVRRTGIKKNANAGTTDQYLTKRTQPDGDDGCRNVDAQLWFFLLWSIQSISKVSWLL